MKSIKPDIGPRSSSQAITQLQDVLALLIQQGRLRLPEGEQDPVLAKLRQERAWGRYGEVTSSLVITFRNQIGHGGGELVDAPTADALNRELRGIGALRLAVAGRVRHPDGSAAANTLIFAFDPEFWGGAQLGEATTNADGFYSIDYDPTLYTRIGPGVDHTKPGLDLVVFAFDEAGAVIASSDVFRDPPDDLEVNLTLGEVRVRPDATRPDHADLRVRGAVVDTDGAALSGIKVEAFDRDIGPDLELLGSEETRKDPPGFFEITYKLSKFEEGDAPDRGKVSADLMFKLSRDGADVPKFDITRLPVEPEGPISVELPIPEEEKILGIVARPDELVRIVAHGIKAPRGQSEYERLMEALKPLVRRRALAEFDEAGTRDVTFAAREIGEPVALVADLVWAHRMTAEAYSESPPEAIYGLARQLGTRDARSLAARGASELAAGIGNAITAMIIPELGDDLTAIATLIHQTSVRVALSAVPTGAGGSLGDILKSALPARGDREALLARAANHTGTDKEFWEAYRSENPTAPIDDVQYAIQLGALTSNNAPLVAALKAEAPEAKSLRTLALMLDRRKIDELVTLSGGAEERSAAAQATYAREINGLLEAAHPTAVVARLAQAWSRTDPKALLPLAADVLTKTVLKTDFDMTRGDIDELVDTHGDVLLEGVNDPDRRAAAVDSVKRVHRLFNVSTEPAILDRLVLKRMNGTLPLRGAIDIARYGKKAFIANFPDATAEEIHALSYVHDRSRAVADTVANLVVGQHQDHRDVVPAAAAGPLTARSGEPTRDVLSGAATPAGTAVPEGTPIKNWSDLFGGAEMCECDDCRSVIGPAAYLVDLFEFLDKRCAPDPTTLVTPLDVLIGHPTKSFQPGGAPGIIGMRPDLARIKLTCENTLTTIPAIDLINEILESVVASGADTPTPPDESSPGVTGPELSAAPEHVLEAAYDKVGNAVYPISLPYDRRVATARVYLRQAGTSRAELIRLLSDAPAAEREGAMVAETLGLLRRDYEILTFKMLSGAPLSDSIEVADLFGFAAGDASWMGLAAKSRRLLAALEITFEELVTLIRTRFIGGEVPTGNPNEPASRLFLTVDQLKTLREADYTVEPGSDIEEALKLGGLSIAEVRSYIEDRLPRLATTIVLDPPIGCSPDEITLRYLDAGFLTDEAEWLAMHRFVRLARRMKISFSDLDAALFALTGGSRPEFTPELLADLADLRQLKHRLELDWPVVASLIADIDTHGSASLYDTLFPPRGFARVNPEFQRGPAGEVLTGGRDVAEGLPGMATAFGLNNDALRDLAKTLGVTQLDLTGVSAIHRAIVLSRSIGLKPEEMVAISKSTGGPDLAKAPIALRALAGWVAQCRDFSSAGLSSAVAYVTGQQPADVAGVGKSLEILKKILADLDSQLKLLAELEAREKTEEAERAEAQKPFTTEEIAARESAAGQRRHAAVLAHFASAFGLAPPVVDRLLDDTKKADDTVLEALLRHDDKPAVALLAHELNTRELQDAADRLLVGMDRIAVLINSARLDPPTFALAAGDAASITFDAIAGLMMDQPSDQAAEAVQAMLADLTNLAALIRDTGRPAAMAGAVTDLARSGWVDATFASVGSWLDRPAAVVRTAVEAAARIDTSILIEATARKRPVAALAALCECLSLPRRIGMEAADTMQLAKEPIGSETLEKLMKGLSSRYARGDWLALSRQLSDPIREESRDALTAFLLDREKLQSAEELFDRFYIDVGTNAFVLTSRIRQAIFAVQIFIQRCLMGFEIHHGVKPDQIDVEEWKTISRQAVWAARGKALLYPEELLNPSWRDNKSPAFKSFESALQQGDITPANAEIAYRAYLDELLSVASLEVCGTYLQVTFEGREAHYFGSVLHVVGRTRGGAARKYFYRRLNRYEHHEEWTSWEPVDVDIQAIEPDRQEARSEKSDPLREAGVHLLPVVWRGQVYLFWPTFVRKVDQQAAPPEVKNGTTTARYSYPYWEIKLCWTRKEGASWTPKEQSSALFETWWHENDAQPLEWDYDGTVDYGFGVYVPDDLPKYPDPGKFVLKANNRRDALDIVVSTREGPWGPKPRGTFSFSRAASEMRFSRSGGEPYGDHFRAVGSSGAAPSFMGFRARGKISFVATHKNPGGDVLFTPSSEARFTTLNQFYAAPFNAPMFIDLEDRAYFAHSSAGVSTIQEKVEKPESKPAWIESAKTFDPHLLVSAIAAKAKEVKNPWVTAAVSSNVSHLATMTESAGGIAVKSKFTADFEYYVGPTFREVQVPGLNVDVKPFFHPFADKFTEVLRREGLAALLTPEMQRMTLDGAYTFAVLAKPNSARVTAPTVEGMDFEQSTPYGNYNWELFFHAPVMLAQKLFDNGHYDAAVDLIRRAVYTPFAADPKECWRFEGLRNIAPMRLDAMLALLSRPDSDPEKQNVCAQIDTMRLYPFQAHRIARLRPLAYKKWVVAFDVRLHLALGDRFFRRFTPEDVNQAVQYYMIAYREMGRRPEIVPRRAAMPARSYAELRPDLDAMGNVMFVAESRLTPASGSAVAGADSSATGIMQRGAISYFCIPKNEKLLALWDEVADRLFKIRNGMNIDGVQMQLPLFSPPIDPALLAEAVASGLDIGTVLEQLAQPLPKHRYAFMYRRAVEHAEAVMRLGDLLLAAREKRDNEHLALRHARHAKDMAILLAETRRRELEEAEANRDAVIHEEDTGKQRWMHFAELLGELPDRSLFFMPYQALPARKLTLVDADKISFESLSVIPDIAKIGFLGAGLPGLAVTAAAVDESAAGIRQLGAGKVLQEEQQELESSFEAVKTTFEAAMLDTLASLLGVIPNFEAAVKPLGAGAAVHLGGQFFAAAASAKARNKRAAADMQNFVASVYRKQADFILRERGWVLEMNQAAHDVLQARRRKTIADIRVDLAQKAVGMQKKDKEHTEVIETFLKEKFTSFELYEWMDARLSRLFKECCALAIESACMAEACYAFERERPATPFIRMAVPANARDELLAGHELMARLRDMDRAYLAAPRPNEQTMHISLRQIDPYALNDLREKGEASFKVPEVLFDIAHPGHYDRRIWSVQVTIPCVTGPYVPVTGTLTLEKHTRRKNPKLNNDDEPEPSGASITLSSGRSDAGLFELSSQDPLYRPFEGMGVVSTWNLSLPKALRNFDYWSINDVVLTMQYTSKRGSDDFRNKVSDGLKDALNTLTVPREGEAGVYQLISVRHELPDVWHRFMAGRGLSVAITTEMLPFMLRELNIKLIEVAGKVRSAGDAPSQRLQFKAPEGQTPRWTLQLEDSPPDVLQTPEKIKDITLFACFRLQA